MRLEEATTEHLQMWLDDIRTKLQAVFEHGTKLEKGFQYFQIVRQKLEIELEIDKRKDKK